MHWLYSLARALTSPSARRFFGDLFTLRVINILSSVAGTASLQCHVTSAKTILPPCTASAMCDSERLGTNQPSDLFQLLWLRPPPMTVINERTCLEHRVKALVTPVVKALFFPQNLDASRARLRRCFFFLEVNWRLREPSMIVSVSPVRPSALKNTKPSMIGCRLKTFFEKATTLSVTTALRGF